MARNRHPPLIALIAAKELSAEWLIASSSAEHASTT